MVKAKLLAIAVCVARRRRKKFKAFGVHPLNANRYIRGQFVTLYEDLRQQPDNFLNYFQMSISTFDELLNMLSPLIALRDTNMRSAIPPVQRLAVTLRFLASGNSFHDLHKQFQLGVSTIHYIIKQVCVAIWTCLSPMYLPEKEKDFRKISEEFYSRTKFPNVIGAVDGKHIEIAKPNENGSLYYNYKKHFSIILMAICDANYCFTCIEVGAYGGSTNSNVFKNTSFYRQLQSGQIDLPEPNTLPNDPNGKLMPFVLIGDEAFALSEHILRPYPHRNLTVEQRVYNYRLARARRTTDCTFGILSNKWKILQRAIHLQPDGAILVTKACCILHNFIGNKDGFQFNDTLYDSTMQSLQPTGLRSNNVGLEIRDYFTKYFTSPQGSIPRQYQIMNR